MLKTFITQQGIKTASKEEQSQITSQVGVWPTVRHLKCRVLGGSMVQYSANIIIIMMIIHSLMFTESSKKSDVLLNLRFL